MHINTESITTKNLFFRNYNHKQIKRFKKVDENLYRGGKPDKIQMLQLKKMGIDTIVDFTINYVIKQQNRKEYKMAKNLGINYVNLPFPAFNNPDMDYLKTFFEITDEAKRENKKIYIHCAQGKDRTGLFAALYKLRYNLDDINGTMDEMLSMGYNSTCYPNLARYLKIYNKTIQKPNRIDYNSTLGQAKILMDKKINQN